MKFRFALGEVAEVTESQWGMVTSAQAVARGLSHVDLTRLADSGVLVRLAHGVYKDAGAPSDEHEAIRAAWLSIEPSRLAWERVQERPSFATVSGETATVLHAVGDLRGMSIEFTTQKRRQTQREDLRFKTRVLTREDVMVRAGLPVTTIERTIADLMEARTQIDHVGRVVRDSARKTTLDTDRLTAYLAPLAVRNGHRKNDGGALLQQLYESAGIDRESVASQIAGDSELSALIASKYLASLPDPSNLSSVKLHDPTAAAATRARKEREREIAEQFRRADWVSLIDIGDYSATNSEDAGDD